MLYLYLHTVQDVLCSTFGSMLNTQLEQHCMLWHASWYKLHLQPVSCMQGKLSLKPMPFLRLRMALQVSKNLPDIAQKTDIAPESIGAKANVRN